MKLIRPQPSTLTVSNIIEPVGLVYSSATTYNLATVVSVYTGTTANLYYSAQAANLNHDPATSPTWWTPNGVTYAGYSSAVAYALNDQLIDPVAHRQYQSLSGGTAATATMTIAAPCVVTWVGHGLPANTQIMFTTTGALPTGITAGTVYYVYAPTTDTFNLVTFSGGVAAIASSGTQSGTHTATARPNKNRGLLDPTFWLDVGPTNKTAMFDLYNGTATSHPSLIDVTLTTTGRVDYITLLNLANVDTVRAIITSGATTVFDQTFPMGSTDAVSNWFTHFFEEIIQKSVLLIAGLPVYANPTVRVIITGNGAGNVSCGVMVAGLAKDLGRTLHDGAQVGIVDYSRKTVDAFGNYTIVQRAFSKRGTFKVRMAKGAVDGVHSTLAAYRAIPSVYIGSEDYGSTVIFGFFKDFQIEIDYPLESLCSIEVEGLT